MKILAFDTSTKFLSIACLDDKEVKSTFHQDVGIKHSEILIPTISDTLDALGWSIREVELVCVGIGPGSFTGLRIAVATVKGFAAVLGNNIAGVPTMDAIAVNYGGESKLAAPLLDARKGKVYSCVYDFSKPAPERVTDYLLVTIDELLDSLTEETVFFGDAVNAYKEKIKGHPLAKCGENIDWFPKAPDIGRLGFERFSLGEKDAAETINPMYLHAQECNITRVKP